MSRLPLRYTGWMIRDLISGSGILMAVLVSVAAWAVGKVQVIGPSGDADLDVCLAILSWTAMGLTLIATAGVVSGDFAQGYQRTLFAKPVSPPLYYLQRWLLGGSGVLIGALIIAQAIALRFGTPMLDSWLLARIMLLYLVLGGLVFLLSTVSRRDWLIAAALVAWQGLLEVARSAGLAQGVVGTALHAILPPIHLIGLRGPPPDGVQLVQGTGYGLALLLGALAVLQWRPLARGARE